jgi:hypothetical protein
VVYDIKCIIDKLLDATENISDELLNDFGLSLRPLNNAAVQLLCEPLIKVASLNIAGICNT